MTRVLIARAGALGDLLLLRQTIACLQHAGRTVALLAPSGPAAALVGQGCGDVAEVLPWEAAGFAGLLADGGVEDGRVAARLRRFDAALAYTRNATLTRNMAGLVATVLQHDPAPPAAGPHAGEWLASCLPALGVPVSVPPPILNPSEEDQHRASALADALPPRFLAIHPGSGSPAKNWPAARFAELVRSLAPERWLLVRGPADDAATSGLEKLPGACVARELPLRTLAAVLARAGAYVGNDSGITHLAAASGASTIALFAPTDPRLWAPVGPHVDIVRGTTMEGITLDAVAAAVARAMSGARGLPSG